MESALERRTIDAIRMRLQALEAERRLAEAWHIPALDHLISYWQRQLARYGAA